MRKNYNRAWCKQWTQFNIHIWCNYLYMQEYICILKQTGLIILERNFQPTFNAPWPLTRALPLDVARGSTPGPTIGLVHVLHLSSAPEPLAMYPNWKFLTPPLTQEHTSMLVLHNQHQCHVPKHCNINMQYDVHSYNWEIQSRASQLTSMTRPSPIKNPGYANASAFLLTARLWIWVLFSTHIDG